ncbi:MULTISPECIES: phosphoglucosamine mutase [Pseudanabaena]|uniref:Phosphoglucosamine mutase n=2 Tax=Pseudanabaena TaxID=1152 RepID=L8MUC6_9CYAN|nr:MULTISPECIES: phosphoglucosamine mutase [Pseudanabaena]ELS30379.1 phosphoglucosamine mutase [Pseudanabaena biceps PCC 7429]MDG3497347.1 phosphoglucosamine mutase [Pseudanabaena catenata USMAC16]
MKLFGTDGIRGHVGDFLTATLALEVGISAGKILKERVEQDCADRADQANAIAIGQDSRTSGDMLSTAISAGLTAAGWDVWHIGLCPTPAVAYLTANSPEIFGGVMISASHNPPEDNGIKFFGANGTKLCSETQQAIEAVLEARGHANLSQPSQDWGKYQEKSHLIDRYQESLQTSIATDLSGLKVVLDLAYGSATLVSMQVFRNLGAEVICLHQEPDGDRINVNCGSTHLEPLRTAVKEHHADMGFAFDGDADRVLAVDRHGRIVDGDYILYLWGQELMEKNQLPNSEIVTTVMANLGFERAWQKLGGNLVRTAVGDQYVHAEMVRSGAMLGGEQSGHVLCRHYAVSGDGLLAALHLAALAKQKAPLDELMDRSFHPFPQLLKNVRVEDRDQRRNWQSCDALVQAIALAEQDLGDRGRILVRASGTEPLMRVMVEAETFDLANHWTNSLVGLIEKQLVKA